ncbi:hypothetical protein [Burkholderia latens]|uniref:hypothetical protein n=1 Tax=Burkholderia latens TaxID=488446 RepID=UPI0039A4C4C6
MSLRVPAARHSTKVRGRREVGIRQPRAQRGIARGRIGSMQGVVRAGHDARAVSGFQVHALSPSMSGAKRPRAQAARASSALCAGFVREYGRWARRWEIKYSADRHLKSEWGAIDGSAPRHMNCVMTGSIHIDISGGVMQRYSIRQVSRAVFAGVLIAGLAAGAGCKKTSNDTGTSASSDTSATGGMSPAPSTAPSGMPSSGTAGADSGTTGGAASMPGTASTPAGASGGG